LKFGTATVHYNDEESLDRQLFSTYRYFDIRLIVDGPFLGYPRSKGIHPYAFHYYPDSERVYCPDLTEAQKRNIYLKMAEQYKVDWLLILDSDEYVYFEDICKFKKECNEYLDTNHNVYGVLEQNGYNDQFSYKPRLWYKPWEMIYEGCHYCYRRKDHRDIRTMAHEFDSLTILHDKDLRDKEYFDNWKVFREYQVRTEGS